MDDDMLTSRNEEILTAIADGSDGSGLKPPKSREEALLIRILGRINDMGGKISVHICTSSEYDHITGVPSISNPDENTFYLVPSGSGDDMYQEWIYTGRRWEKFGSGGGGSIDIPQSDWNQTDTTANDYIKNKPDLTTKLDVNQGSGNAGKILGIGSDGAVEPVSASGGGVINDSMTGTDTTWSSARINAVKANKKPHNYTFDGVDLSMVFTDADAMYNAYNQEDYSNIHVGDYWPVTLNGTYRDYGNYSAPVGTDYYSDTALTSKVGETDEVYVANGVQNTNLPGCHEDYCSIKIGSTTYYVAYSDCLDYQERTLSNVVMKFEVAGINQYWRYGDSGANNFQNGVPHLLMSARDGLPHTLKMRRLSELWENTVIDTFTGDGTTADFTLSGTVGTIGYVYVAGARKTYNTDYTFGSDKITFKSGKIPVSGAVIQIEWMPDKTPWTGCALYRTFNDPDYGIIKLIQQADTKLYNHIYKGPNSAGMRYYGETRSKTNQQSGAWEDRGVLFLPTEDEIWGRQIRSTSADLSANQQQWPIYQNGGRRHFAKGSGNAASRLTVWASSSTSVTHFASVYFYGNAHNYNATGTHAAAPAFLLT